MLKHLPCHKTKLQRIINHTYNKPLISPKRPAKFEIDCSMKPGFVTFHVITWQTTLARLRTTFRKHITIEQTNFKAGHPRLNIHMNCIPTNNLVQITTRYCCWSYSLPLSLESPNVLNHSNPHFSHHRSSL